MSERAAFTAMEHGSRSDYDLIAEHDRQNAAGLAGRVIHWLGMMDGESPYQISRLDHSLQCATRAERDGADDESIACALLHDIGDVISPCNHSQVAAALLRPYVGEKNYWIVLHHGLFQGYYWMHHYDMDRNARDRLRDEPHYEACVEFCARWDQVSFDPRYRAKPLAHFVPLVEALLRKPLDSFM